MADEIPLKIKDKLTVPKAHEFESTDAVGIINGGTGANTAPNALTNLGAIPVIEKAASLGVATLDAFGKVPISQIPARALPDVYVVFDDTARLALTVQEGDEAIQTVDDTQWIYDGTVWVERPNVGPSPITVREDGIDIQSAIFLNFLGDLKVTGQGAGVVDIDLSIPRAYLQDGFTIVNLV